MITELSNTTNYSALLPLDSPIGQDYNKSMLLTIVPALLIIGFLGLAVGKCFLNNLRSRNIEELKNVDPWEQPIDLEINSIDEEGNTPLHLVRDVEIAKLYVEDGAKLNIKNNKGETPLETARKKGYKDVVEYLKSQAFIRRLVKSILDCFKRDPALHIEHIIENME